jgi:hypothetical protein
MSFTAFCKTDEALIAYPTVTLGSILLEAHYVQTAVDSGFD